MASSEQITKCLFPVAGYGTRFLPVTKSVPKEMLPIVGKPLVQYGVEEAVQAGMHDITFVTGRGKRAIEDHFDRNVELEAALQGSTRRPLLDDLNQLIESCSFSYTRQIEMRGLGHAILAGRPIVGHQPFGVVLVDDLCFNEPDGVMKQMVDLFDEHRCSIVAIEEVPPEATDRYGIVAGEQIGPGLYRVDTMVEKPEPADAPSNLAIIGRYLLTPDIFEILEHTPPGRGGEIQITDALMAQAREGGVVGYQFHGERFDCGSIDGFVSATNHCYERL